jgi:hypothetical protein
VSLQQVPGLLLAKCVLVPCVRRRQWAGVA